MNRPEQSDERTRLIGFIRTVFEFLNSQSPMPGAMVSPFDQIRWDDAPLSALKMAAADMVEWCQDLVGEPLAALDATLATKQLPTLTAMRHRQYKEAIRILARNSVRNDAEWHTLNRLADDSGLEFLSPAERDQIARLLREYRPR